MLWQGFRTPCCQCTGSACGSRWDWQPALCAPTGCQIDLLLNSTLLPSPAIIIKCVLDKKPRGAGASCAHRVCKRIWEELPLLAAFPACSKPSSKLTCPHGHPESVSPSVLPGMGKKHQAGQASLIFNASKCCHFLLPSPGSCL